MHKKIAFLELIGGVSGDMLIGALIDAGLSKKDLLNELNLIDLPRWNLEAHLVNRCAVKATHINFVEEKKSQKKYGWNDFTNIINDLLKKEYLKKNKQLKILDYGCGSMEISKKLETKNYIKSIVGSDIFKHSFKLKKLTYVNNERLFKENETIVIFIS